MTDVASLRGCTAAILHGPADAQGRCPWCKVKYEGKRARPLPGTWHIAPDLIMAYRRFYDPDWGIAAADYDI